MTLSVGPLPGRKAVALYVEDQGSVEVCAYFRTPYQAIRVMNLLDRFMEAGG
jgi:hypothetical protein